MPRDDFKEETKRRLGFSAGYLCSCPGCPSAFTIGPANNRRGYAITGRAAHITAAAVGGPRYDPTLSREQRCSPDNGIWLCANHASLIDEDEARYTVVLLREWKAAAEVRADRAHLHGTAQLFAALEAQPPLSDRLEASFAAAHAAAQADLERFKATWRWPGHAIALTLGATHADAPFGVPGAVQSLLARGGLAITAAPGAGKTTMALQLVDALLHEGHTIAIYVPLGEWSTQADTLIGFVRQRAAFQGFVDGDLRGFAAGGRLTLVLDGWNELSPAAQRRARTEVEGLRRDYELLNVAVTTRGAAAEIPLAGAVAQVLPLSDAQQLEIAEAIAGAEGRDRLTFARRTAGSRDLLAIPLYLATVLKHAAPDAQPTTKGEVLRLLVAQHEQPGSAAYVGLIEELQGRHEAYLVDLAMAATRGGSTVLNEADARGVVATTTQRLEAAGQIANPVAPGRVLQALANHHVLATAAPVVTFNHQQLQEWYASQGVEALVRAMVGGDEAARRRLRAEILDVPVWEEAILFASERLARAGIDGAAAAASCIREALTVDPILAAELIARSTDNVWGVVSADVVRFAESWHEGTVDRGLRFIVMTGRPEFAEFVWRLIGNPDSQVHLGALRVAPRFRVSVLGDDPAGRLATLPEVVRKHTLVALVHDGGAAGIVLADAVARIDPSVEVQVAYAEALLFRGATRELQAFLRDAEDAVWRELARHGLDRETEDAAIKARLVAARDALVAEARDPAQAVAVLLASRERAPEVGERVAALMQAETFPGGTLSDQRWFFAAGAFPEQVGQAMLARLEARLPVPWGTRELLAKLPQLDEGPIPQLVLEHAQGADVAVAIVGARTIGALIDRYLAARLARSETAWRIRDVIGDSRREPFIEAWLECSATDDPQRISVLASLLSGHGRGWEPNALLMLEAAPAAAVAEVLNRWAGVLLASADADRGHFASLTQAIGRIGSDALVDSLHRLFEEDQRRSQDGRARALQARARGEAVPPEHDARISYGLDYARAFGALAGPRVATLMQPLLTDHEFGRHAALVLKQVHHVRANVAEPSSRFWGHDFSGVPARRSQARDPETTAEADQILNVAQGLARAASTEADCLHALRLATVGLTLPHGDRRELEGVLCALPVPIARKLSLLLVLAVNGRVVDADLAVQGVRDCLARRGAQPWRDEQAWSEIEDWLILVAFSEAPERLHDVLGEMDRPPPWRLRKLLTALRWLPGDAGERVLGELARRDRRLLGSSEWLHALLDRETVSAAVLLLDMLTDITTEERPDPRVAAELLATVAKTAPELRAELRRRYESAVFAASHPLIEHALTLAPDLDSICTVLRQRARRGIGMDWGLRSALEELTMERRPVANWQGAYELHSVDAAELRALLFARVIAGEADAALATDCLTVVDELRDEHGRPPFEPRHPNLAAGHAWPIIE